MEMPLLVLLLLCAVSGAKLEEIKVTDRQQEAGPESVNVQTHSCLSDIHAVLRDMSAKLAEDRLLIQQLLALSQAQAAELKSLKTQADVTENHVDTLRNDRAAGQVAFSASVLDSGAGYTGPFSSHTTLILKNVVTNIGKAYSPVTGLFTAPVRGVYHFEFYIYENAGHSTAAGIEKNGQNIFAAHEQQSGGTATAANAATLLLEAGDVVSLRLWEQNRIYDNQNHHTTFSGRLLFPMSAATVL